MKRIIILLLALLVLLTASPLFAAGGGQQQQGPRVFRYACNQPDGYPTVVGALAFSKYVEEQTRGAIRIDVFSGAVLGDERVTTEQTQTGDIHFIRLGVTFLASISPQVGALGLPFLYRDREHMFKALDGPIGDEVLKMLERQNLLGLAWMDAGFRNFYNNTREVKTLEDMRGLRIRVQETPLMMGLVRMLGASPTPMAFGEVYSAIQNGIVDGAENNWPSYISVSHFEVARFFTTSGHVASPEMILVNTRVWNSFSQEEQRIIKAGALHGANVQREDWLRYERDAEARARSAGRIITDLSPAERVRFTEAVQPMYQQPEYAPFADLIRRIRAVQ